MKQPRYRQRLAHRSNLDNSTANRYLTADHPACNKHTYATKRTTNVDTSVAYPASDRNAASDQPYSTNGSIECKGWRSFD